ncbi:MAG: nucleotide exchange factor GrpE, partial [Clostridia bacterium]|nr:nucleotide exchange factor GrpE [Clostridia bacterium]
MSEETKTPLQEEELSEETAEPAVEPETAEAAPEQPAVPTAEEQLAELNDRYMRLAAEYDNFRKRTARERESLTAFVVCDTAARFLPVIDSLQLAEAHKNGKPEDILAGLDKVLEALTTTLKSIGLEEIDTSGEFDPNWHNAVMHVEDESLPANAIAEVFQKGYKYQDKVVRHA